MKKFPILTTLCALSFATLVGCGGNKTPAKKYTVSFKNYDGTLLSESKVKKGGTAVYEGINPTRAETSEYTYAFNGWDQSLDNITSDCTRVAQYTETLKPVTIYYTVSFKNWDGSLICDVSVEAGDTAIFDREDPTRPETTEYSYTFKGWDESLENITSNCTRIAQFNEIAKPVTIYHTVSFKNWDGTLLSEISVEDGGTAVYDKENEPTRPETDQYTYTFKGWDKPLTNVKSDLTLIAQFNEIQKQVTPKYTVTFKNWDGTILQQVIVIEGGNATYGGTTPSRPATPEYTYAFTGWDASLENITSDCIRTAQFSPTNVEYSVKFYSYDNQLLYTDVVYYQQQASYYGDTPTKPDTETHSYVFKNWDKDYSCITKSINVYPVFEEVGKTIQVTVKPNNGDPDQVVDFTYDEAYDLGTPSNPGYAFGGWFINETTSIPTSGTWDYTGVTTISARWETGNFNFTLNDDNASYTVSLTEEGKTAKNIVIPSNYNDLPVTTLAANFAKQNTSIETLTIPGTIKAIPEYAFYQCSNLNEVNLNDGLLSIGQYAFHTTKIQKMIVPSTCTSIGAFAFDYCSELYHVYIPISVTSVGRYAFDGMHSTGYVCIEHNSSTPSGFSSDWTDNVVYYQATKLVETEDYNYVIRSNYGDLNATIIRLSEATSKLQSFTFPSEIEGITDIRVGYQLFYQNKYIRNVTFTNVTRIGNMAFTYCSNLESITLTDSLTFIGKQAFRYCYALKRVDIPDSVTEISEMAFDTCKELEYAFVPDSVVTIGSYAFDECDKLTIYTTAHSTKYGWNSTWNGANPVCPTYYDYDHNDETEDFNYVVQSYMGEQYVTITSMKASAKLKKNIVIPNEIEGVSDIRLIDNLFKGFSELVSIDLGTGVKKIPESCFYNIDKLETVILHEGVTSIGVTAFYSCGALKSINMPSTLTTIGKQAFDYCSALREVVIPQAVTTIGAYAFDDSGVLALLIESSGSQTGWVNNWAGPSGYKQYIYDYASSGTVGDFKYAKTDNGVTQSIYIYRLVDNCMTTNLVVPDEVEGISNIKIANRTFHGNTFVKTVDLGNSVTYIGGYAFNGNTYLVSVIIPASCLTINANAFTSCPTTCVIHCEAEEKPDGWDSNWNSANCTLDWGFTR